MSSRRAARAGLGAVALLAATTLTAGCGGHGSDPGERAGEHSGQTRPDRETLACRQQWAALEDQLSRRAGQQDVSAQAGRWDSLAAGAHYFATTAKPADCEAPLAQERDRVEALSTYSARLAAYDMPHQLAAVTPAVLHYLAAPPPRSRHGRPPSRQEVRQALEALRRAAPRAMADLHPAWQQAGAVDPGDPARVRRAVAGLHLLAGDSAAFATCEQALRTLRSATRSERP